ncbi:TetR/AcrR family transcriptional regulator C-terminal domain-containing protein [Nocardioides sp.]|jgi:AcrR family transcriptional regulator|uniref:TetR/AcrR family transcriptional regulator C-terminal domain-containing protein n=1 Tax=Nocardioides sp. TaxID=35761 RepID=UPI002BD385CD|nr:TetR/AcrR family transcriptional regulator C-terminal domain-containing protein [Nocardioides sp.]HVX53104.1 TetR/AcrR family transcriptional regulator C-terminal domain-containing protein [Nocardioides sp.]
MNRNHRRDVVAKAIEVLDDYGLADLTMRRLGAELGVRPSALYHHFADKQTLLAAVADELLARANWPATGEWADRAAAICATLRDQLLAYRDGAELVATVHSFGLGARQPYELLVAALAEGGVGGLAPQAARTLLHFVYGHAVDEQTHLQAAAAGAIDDDPRESDDFGTGLGIVIAGIQVVRAARQLGPTGA